VLDMGTGSGVLGIEAAGNADSVVAVDINPIALRIAKRNALKHSIRNLSFRRSDLFSNVKGKFDLIIFNPPYLPQDKGIADSAIYGGRQGHETVERFLCEAGNHLEDDGAILLLFSSLTGKKRVEELIVVNLFEHRQLSTQHIFFEDLYVYLLKKSPLHKRLSVVKNLKPYASGKRGVVYTGRYRGRRVAVKIKNPGSSAPARIQIEAHILAALNKRGIGPRVFEAEDNFIIMEYVDGVPILEYFEAGTKAQIKAVVRKVLLQLYALDELKINKEEMHHPVKHIIVRRNNPVLIDFERAKYSQKAHNVTQFCQFMTSAQVTPILSEKGILLSKQLIMQAARDYSKNSNKEDLNKIISLVC
jgi:release factor glutamine methyltransferase